MAKRFTDTDKWTKNKWFRTLSKDYKLFWLFLLDNCDCVGVWEEDLDFVADLLGIEISEAQKVFARQIKIIADGRKWWIVNFCLFQYGELKEGNLKNKPHLKYISELKKHRLWIDYTKTIHSLKEEDKEEEEEKDKEKDKGVQGEKQIDGKFVVQDMNKVFKETFPGYPDDVERDFKPLYSIAEFICGQHKLGRPTSNYEAVMSQWRALCLVIKDSWYRDKSLSTISNKIQEITQIQKNGTGNNFKGASSKRSRSNATDIIEPDRAYNTAL